MSMEARDTVSGHPAIREASPGRSRLVDILERIGFRLQRHWSRTRGMLLKLALAESRGPIETGPGLVMRGRQHVHCLGRLTMGRRNRIEAYARHGGRTYTPHIVFGHNVSMEDDCHIAAVNRVEIHDNVLLASKVYISDHSHGTTSFADLQIPPNQRPVLSPGSVVIEADVWIGEGAAVLPGVRIGRGAVVGANAVVTRDVPSYCTVGGAPARILRRHGPQEAAAPQVALSGSNSSIPPDT